MKKILDACCGGKMFWFDKKNPNVLFMDNRHLDRTLLCDGRHLEVSPDLIADFRNMPFDDNTFNLVVFDPPHLIQAGKNGYMSQKYGTLNRIGWQEYIKKGFDECFRVLKKDGVLIFKWNETDIPVSAILKIIEHEPLFGHKSGKASKTHWLCFFKTQE